MTERVRLQPNELHWLMIALLSVLNFLVVLLSWETGARWLAVPFFGVLLSEWNWLAVWAVFGPTPWKTRVPEVLCGMFALLFSLCAGSALHERIAPRDLVEFVCLLPLAMIATQSPLWLIRFLFAWRIHAKRDPIDGIANDCRRFDLRHIFAATAVVAVSLGVARGAGAPAETLLSILIGLPFIGVFTSIPCICTGIVVANSRDANTILAAYVLLIPGIALGATSIRLSTSLPREFIASLCGFMFGTSVVVHSGLRLIRAEGFVMTAPRISRRAGSAKSDS